MFLVPGLIAYIAMITAVISTALSVVREKERGTMEQVRMAPLDAASFIVGKTMPYFVISLVSAFGIIFAAMVLFGLPMRGSWPLLLRRRVAVPGRRARTGAADLDVADTSRWRFRWPLLVSFLPTLMLSGFIFPIASMPAFLQMVTYVVPARYFLIALRGIVLKGVGLGRVLDGSGRARGVRDGRADAGVGPAAPAVGLIMRRIALSRLEGADRAAARSAAVRHRHPGADHSAVHARLRRDHRRPERAVVVADADRSARAAT